MQNQSHSETYTVYGASDPIGALLAARERTHGSYSVHANCTQLLKRVLRKFGNWKRLSPTEREALEMIMHKVGRIMAGDPHYVDHWDDIAGYASLVAKEHKRS